MAKKKSNKLQNQVVCIEKADVAAKPEANQNKAVATLSNEEKASQTLEIQKKLKQLYKELDEIDGRQDGPPLNNEERAMIERWKDHQKKNESPYGFHAYMKSKTKNGTKDEKFDLALAGLFEATGSSDLTFGFQVLGKCALASCIGNNNEDPDNFKNHHDSIANAMNAMKPKDEIEGMLISRLVALHFQSMYYLACAANSQQTTQGREININLSTKLSRVYNETLEALMRYRRKGKQEVIVQHVQVSGGQTIVNNGSMIAGGGGGQQKNSEVTS